MIETNTVLQEVHMPKVIDLTHVIVPEKNQRRFSVETIGAETVNHNVVRKDGQWYIMTNISMVSHIATHIVARSQPSGNR